MQFAEGQSPLDYLEQASICRATAINHELNDAHLHYLLGQTLEEHYYAEMYGLRKKVKIKNSQCSSLKYSTLLRLMHTEQRYKVLCIGFLNKTNVGRGSF